MKITKAQLTAENEDLKAEVKRLSDRTQMIARWILTERAKLIVGKSREDHQCEEKSPLPVTLWRCAQELAGDITARMANEIANQQRKKLGIAEHPATDASHEEEKESRA